MTPAPPEDWEGTENYSTLADVRENLEEGTEEDSQRSAIDRVIVRARRRLEALRSRGMRPRELEGRLIAAEALAEQGEVRAALLLLEEVLVLAKVMAEHGEAADPVDLLIAERLDEGLRALLLGSELRSRVDGLASAHVDARAEEIRERLGATIEKRLAALLGEERFEEAASAAVAARPYPLLDSPEALARIDAVAQEREGGLLESSAFFEQVDGVIRDRLDRFLDDPQLSQRIDSRLEECVEAWMRSTGFSVALRGRVEEIVRTELRASPTQKRRTEGR
jgi:hypothetical protein